MMKKKIFVSYLDDNDEKVTAFVDEVIRDMNSVTIINDKNIITIPYHRLYKIKESKKSE